MDSEKNWTLLERLEGSDSAAHLLSGTFFLGALIGAGASLVGGLFGKSSAEKKDRQAARAQAANDERNRSIVDFMNNDLRRRAEAAAAVPIETYRKGWETGTTITKGEVDMAAFMKAAESNGFNPLTFLRSGALGLFAKSRTDQTTNFEDKTSVYNSQLMDAALAGGNIFQYSQPLQKTAPGYGDVFGNALTAGANAFVQGLNQDQQNQFQMKMLNAQLEGVNRAARTAAAGGNSPRRSGYVPTSVTAGSQTEQGGGAFSNSLPPIWLNGFLVDQDPKTTSAQALEDRYGDIVGSFLGLVPAFADFNKTVRKTGAFDPPPNSVVDSMIKSSKDQTTKILNWLDPYGENWEWAPKW